MRAWALGEDSGHRYRNAYTDRGGLWTRAFGSVVVHSEEGFREEERESSPWLQFVDLRSMVLFWVTLRFSSNYDLGRYS